MKKRLLCLMCAIACIFTGCAYSGNEVNSLPESVLDAETGDSFTEETVVEVPAFDWGVALTVKNVTAKGLTLVCTQNGGEAQGELQTGSWYEIQKSENGTWKKAEYTEIDEELVGWTGEAWCIPKGNTVEWEVDWSWLYNELPKGEYRIGKEIMDFSGTGEYEKTVVYAEFQVE